MTNFEKIKAMGIEEMADFIAFFNTEEDICYSVSDYKFCCHVHNCHDCAMKYLQQESEVEQDDQH